MRKLWLGFVVAFLLLGCAQPTPTPVPRTATPRPTRRPAGPTPASYEVEYRLGGTASRASEVKYVDGNGVHQLKSNVEVQAWKEGFTAKPGAYVNIYAITSEEDNTIRVEIWVNGEMWKEAEASGADDVASIDGFIGR